MIEIPYLSENVKIPTGDKTPFVEYTLEDQDGNVIDLSAHSFSAKLVDENGNEQANAVVVENYNQGFRVRIDANALTPGKYTAVVRDETDGITLLKYIIHVEAAI